MQKGAETEVDVTWEDQKMINTFGRLNARKHEMEAERKIKAEELTNLEDANNEIILLDDEEESDEGVTNGRKPIKFSIGDFYVDFSKEGAEERLGKMEAEIKTAIEKLDKDIDNIKRTLGELKIKLYAKFSNAINLEEE
eukprot:TRINITY_DN2399_c0_g2_i1.p1 TRINITY_DN2399_c0_g2~~TRINITY_DN2399_c0_g2_i1.p1  ORF type:complete len:139 (-),score=35.84 TRINITY_DN2399_c0_g2_i1:62-478(-)